MYIWSNIQINHTVTPNITCALGQIDFAVRSCDSRPEDVCLCLLWWFWDQESRLHVFKRRKHKKKKNNFKLECILVLSDNHSRKIKRIQPNSWSWNWNHTSVLHYHTNSLVRSDEKSTNYNFVLWLNFGISFVKELCFRPGSLLHTHNSHERKKVRNSRSIEENSPFLGRIYSIWYGTHRCVCVCVSMDVFFLLVLWIDGKELSRSVKQNTHIQ